MSSRAASELALLGQQLAQIHSGQLLASAFVQQARTYTQLLAALPAPFSPVYHDLLDRLESGALFSEESCSFSQRDLLNSLRTWMDKAAVRLSQ
jgi:hypothetical protein